MTLVPAEEARAICELALSQAGVPLSCAKLQVDLLLEAELRGRPSHGLMRLPRIVERIANGVANPVTSGSAQWRGSSLLLVDGENGLGPVVAAAALALAEQHVKETGVAVVSIRRNNHLGMLAWYAEQMAARGFVLLAVSTSEALVHAWGGRRAMLGTNPIAIGVPTASKPFVLDMATSLVSMGQIHDYAQRGQPLPEGWAVDAAGNPTTDATAAKAGAIAPFGDAKGYALGLAIELLVVSLTASAIGRDVKGTLDSDQECNKGDVFVVIDPSMQPDTVNRISAYLDDLRLSGDQEGPRKVSVPGDRAHRVRNKAMEQGIELPDALWERLTALSKTSISA